MFGDDGQARLLCGCADAFQVVGMCSDPVAELL
jgi:hypothetical protein